MATEAYDYDLIQVEIDAGVAFATLDNPPINLITLPLFVELIRLAEAVEGDDDVRVLVLRSANPGLAQVLDQAPRPVPDVQEQLAARFGPAAFSAASRQLLQKCLAAPARAAVGHAEGATVGAAFCMAQYLRLLLS